jgi:hypothetical protein
VGPDRAIRIFNARGTVNVVVDLRGYYSPTGASTYFPKAVPQTILDSRTTIGGHNGTFGGATEFALQVRGVLGIPADATAVALALICIGGGSDIDVYPQTFTGTSSINCINGLARANMAVTGIGSDGKIRVRNHGQKPVHVVARVLGWYGPGDGSRYVSLPTEVRILDTLSGNGLRGSVGPDQRVAFQVGRLNGVASQATAVVVTLYGYRPAVTTHLATWRGDQTYPNTSTVNVEANRALAVMDATALGPDGMVGIHNQTGSIRVLIDLSGYFVH